jgi:sugar lactone lactonase YvrE
VAFGGEKYESLFITSASYMLDEQKLESEPLAGSIFVADVATRGRAEPKFALSP